MKILFVADLHYSLKQFDWLAERAGRYDAVIVGGDLLDLASALDLDVQIVVVEKYFTRLCELAPLIVSSGNHDGDARTASNESICRWMQAAKVARLHVPGESIEIPGALVTVCPWWDGPESRAQLEAQLAAAAERRRGKWIWVHHAPPDQSPVSWTGKKFAGDEFLPGWIKRFSPDLVLCGHIHNAPFYPDGDWIDRIGTTWVFNPGRQIGPQPAYLEVDLAAMTAEWFSLAGQMMRRLDGDDGAMR
jgi:Icc-related predicted phosphoesterase